MPKVIVGKSRQCQKYHKDDGTGKPACDSETHRKNPTWAKWELEKAKTWKEPCQRPKCYGEVDFDGWGDKDVWP